MKVPKFKNLKEERKFWDSHESTDYLDDFEETKDVVFVRPKKQVISLRLEPQVINKLKKLAKTLNSQKQELIENQKYRRNWNRQQYLFPCSYFLQF